MCHADCGAGVENRCPVGFYCTPDGRCIATNGGDGSNICADIIVEGVRVTPTVMLIVDQSGSMTEDFGGGTRWDVLKDSLLASTGLIQTLEDQVRFGVALYSARSNDMDLPDGECPLITQIDPALNNFGAIDGVYGPADPIQETPTGDAIDAILDQLLSVPDPDPDPTIFIVATDGEPDRCEQLNPQNGQAEAIAAVERAYGAGIRTFMISVGEGTVSAAHLQDMANAGLGRGAGDPPADYWVAGDDAGLRGALEDIVGGVLSCDITLRGTIDLENACTGTVKLNDRELPCDDPNGWRATDENHIELLGTACDELTMSRGARLEASFPCDVVII